MAIRRRRDHSLGQIPLSSSEIELYSRQDETMRRRRQLLAVRDQERRLAQQVTQRYRNNLQKLRRRKIHKSQQPRSCEQQKALTDIYAHYQETLQKVGTAQCSALELMEQAQKEKDKWTYNDQVTGEQRTMEAKKAQEEAEGLTTAGARARQEQDVARQRSKDREALGTQRRVQSPEEVVVTPKPRQGRDEIDQKRERDRVIREAQQEAGLKRGKKALNEVVARRQGQEAMEWLAFIDKMERRARGQELGGGEDYSLGAGDVDESRRLRERAFAQMLGLDEDSVELSVFSIQSDDERSVALTDPDHELLDGNEIARTDLDYRVKLKAAKRSGSFDLRDRSESGGPIASGKGEQAEHRLGKPSSTCDDLQREELEKRKKSEDMYKRGIRLEGVGGPSKARSVAHDSEYEDKLNMSKTRLRGVFHEKTCTCKGHSFIAAADEEHKHSILTARLQNFRSEPPKSDPSAGRSSEAASKASPAENVESKSHLESKCSAERDGSLPSISVSEKGKERVESNIGQLKNNCEVDDHALLETPCSQRPARGDQFISGTTGHRDKYGNEEEQFEAIPYEVGASRSPPHWFDSSPQSLARDKVNEKVLGVTLDLGRKRLSMPSFTEIATDHSAPRKVSTTVPVDASLVKDAEFLSASSSTSDGGNHKSYKEDRVFERTSCRDVVIGEDEQLSLPNSFSAPSQKSLSHLNQVANNREQRFVDQHIMYASESEGRSEDEREAETESHRPSIGINSARSSVNFNPRDSYRQQIHYKAWRSSMSAMSAAQYSLPPSDTQSSFDESLDRLHPGHDDSFVNELVPIFPKRTLPPSPRSLEEDNKALEEYDVQLMTPNMSRMLTSERLPSFGLSGQCLIYKKHQAAATDHLRRQPPASTTSPFDKRTLSSSSSRRSYSKSCSSELDAKSVEQSPARQHVVTGQIRRLMTVAAGSNIRQLSGNSQPSTSDCKERDALSEISSESSVSSLGSTVQLNIAAGATRSRDTGDDGRVIPNSVDSQHIQHAQEYPSDDEVDKESIVSERSFASCSSMSMDAYFNYLIKMSSTVGKSLLLQLQLPPMIHGKDRTKPPAPMTSSASSVSSVDQSDDSEMIPPTARRRIPSSDSSMSDSLLEGQHVRPPRSGRIDYLARDRHSPPASCQSEESDASRASGRMRGTRSGKAARCTFTGSKRETSKLPPSSISSRNMSLPPAPMQNFGRSSGDSGSSNGQSIDDIQQHHVLPPPLGPINMSQPAALTQNFGQSLDGSLSSDRSFQRRGARRHPNRHSYDAEEESKQDDSSSVSSYIHASAASSRRQSMQKAQNMVISLQKSHSDNSGDSDGNQGGKGLSLAEAFQRRHPGFSQCRDNLKRQRDKQQEQQQEQSESEDESVPVKRDVARSIRGRGTADPVV